MYLLIHVMVIIILLWRLTQIIIFKKNEKTIILLQFQ